MENEILILFLLFIIYSFIGWIIEVTCKLYEKHRFINRGFLIGPVCPIYGYGALIILLCLSSFKEHIFLLFAMSIVICSILEYSTSYVMEKIYGIRWWDYSSKKFNLNGRICMQTMIPFGIMSCLIIYIINPFFEKILKMVPDVFLISISITLLIIYIFDNILSFNLIHKLKNTIKSVEKDATEEISIKVKNLFLKRGPLYKRLINAFPNFKNKREYLLELQKNIIAKLKETKNNKNN